MTTCDLCSLEMTTASTCTVDTLHRNGEPVVLPSFGEETMFGRATGPCHDCGVQPTGHHHLGCDAQQCPSCGGQLIACGCAWDELGGDLDDGDDGDDVLDLRTTGGVIGPPRGQVPFGAAAAPARAQHHQSVRGIAEWAMSHGRPCDLDIVAVCVVALERHDTERGMHLDRPTSHGVLWGDVRNVTTLLDTTLPDDWHVHLWSVLHWLDADGRLSVDSDPLAALLEPLRCYGGLGADGYPMPADVDVEFPCQCYVPFDPTLPPGLGMVILGRNPDSWHTYLARAHLVLRSDDPGRSAYDPLFALARRLRETDPLYEVFADEVDYRGWIDAAGAVPRLSIYSHEPSRRRGFDYLLLDGDGHGWVPTADGRRKAGYRLAREADRTVLRRAGIGPSEQLLAAQQASTWE